MSFKFKRDREAAAWSGDIKATAYLLSLSQKATATIKLSLALSMLLNFGAIILAMTGILKPIEGALIDNAGPVDVIINPALLFNFKSESSPMARHSLI